VNAVGQNHVALVCSGIQNVKNVNHLSICLSVCLVALFLCFSLTCLLFANKEWEREIFCILSFIQPVFNQTLDNIQHSKTGPIMILLTRHISSVLLSTSFFHICKIVINKISILLWNNDAISMPKWLFVVHCYEYVPFGNGLVCWKKLLLKLELGIM